VWEVWRGCVDGDLGSWSNPAAGLALVVFIGYGLGLFTLPPPKPQNLRSGITTDKLQADDATERDQYANSRYCN
jgi:hypothetical protein